jgi:hypothetical protein
LAFLIENTCRAPPRESGSLQAAHGLLRFARNDDEATGAVIARSKATKQSILSLWSDVLLREAYHRARIRATRWLGRDDD